MDISLAELVVPSQDCKYFCPRTDHRYAHNESDTYLQVGGYHSVRWPGMNIGGYLSNDVLHLGGLDLEEMIFEEGTDFTCWAVGCQSEGYDGLLGLAGPWEPGTSSVLSVISRRKLVDRGIVSISLPKAKDGSKGAGELVLGAHRAREEDILWLPIHDNAAKYGWAVGADAMIFHTPTEMKLELPAGAVAVFSTTTSTLILPDEMVKNITKALGADQSTFFMSVVPCSQRSYMPDLTFILGGHEFTISAWEYIIEFETWSPQIGSICSVAIHPKSWYVGGEQNGIYLGSAFLRGFEWIGDWDRGRIGCELMSFRLSVCDDMLTRS